MIDRRKEIDRRMAKVQAEIARMDAEQNRPAQLATELAELEQLGAAAEMKRQAALMHFDTVIQRENGIAEAELQTRRADLLAKYQHVRQALDELIAGVKDYDKDALALVNKRAADEAAGGLLVGRKVNQQLIADLFDAVAWQAEHEAMLALLTLVNSQADIEQYASRNLVAVSMLRAGWLRRFSLEYAGQVMAQIPDPVQRLEGWAVTFAPSLAGSS